MNTSIQHPELNGIVQPSGDSSQSEATLSAWRKLPGRFTFAALLAGLLLLLFSAPAARAQGIPPGCTGAGIGITLFTSASDVHIGDTICYSILVNNGTGVGPIVCDASNIVASVVTPDGVTHPITLVRTYLSNAQSDYYPNVICYVVQAANMVSDGLGGMMVRATASDTAIIFQNDKPTPGGANQGVNTEVSQPCIGITAQCVPSAGQNGLITFTGTVTNCGNVTLVGVTVTNSVNGGQYQVAFFATILSHQAASFSGSYIPLNPCLPSTAIFTAQATDQFTTLPRTVTASATTICQNTLTQGIKVTKSCPAQVYPGQPLYFSGSVSNTGTVTLTGIVVVNSQPVPNTQVFTWPSLAPGEVVTFYNSYTAPLNSCSVTDTLTATAASLCGVGVSSVASANCPILTTPQITVTANCPTAPVLSGGSVTYSGTVQNTGNITLTNVVVVGGPLNTIVLTVATLAPGASANFTAGPYTVPANACTVTTTFSGTGKDICGGTPFPSSASPICQVTTAPAIAVTLFCPVQPAVAGGLIIYTGTVRNSGNVTLNNVIVVNSQASPSTVLTVPSLAPGASAPFTASFTAPTDGCSVNSTVTASGNDNCTQALVSNSASATCPLGSTPSIVVTQVCPVSPPIPGGLLTYSGTVQNTGNITLTNVVVLNNLSGTTPVIGPITLAPGAAASFTGSYVAPINSCSVNSTVNATGRSICGVGVINSASATCPILTAPAIVVTAVCPTAPVSPGGSVTYSGTVQNTGNITLTNVVVVSSPPNTTVFTVATLAPGASAIFTSTVTVPANACTVTTTFSGTGKDICTGNVAANTVSATCTVTTAPAIVVTLACPTGSASAGGLITYTGTVRNSGNVTLNNVYVLNNQPAPNTPVIGPLTLAPGASAPFTASFTAPADACSVSSTVTASGNDNCTQALVTSLPASATCQLITTPGIKVTKACPAQPVSPGQTLTFSGSVSNTGNVTLQNIVVFNSQPAPNTPVYTLPSLAPGAVANFTGGYVVPINYFSPVPICSVTDTLTATAASSCGVGASSVATATCPILTAPAIVVTQTCPTTPVAQGGLLIFSGTVRNAGNITLTNIIVVNNWPYPNTVIFTAAYLAPGATLNFTGSYVVPVNCCVPLIELKASGQGCDGVTVTDTDSGTCTVLTSPSIVVTKVCVPTMNRRGLPVLLRPGDLLTYNGTVCNTGNITLYNVTVVDNQPINNTLVIGPIILAPGECKPYAGSYIVPQDFCGADTVTALGFNLCGGAPVVNSATATCPIAPYSPSISVTKQCPPQRTQHGGQLIFTGTVSNLGNVTLVNVFVVNNQPINNTPVIGPITLAPGASFNFTGSYTAPLVCCEMVDTLTARGQDICLVSNVTATATAICPMLYTPGIALVQDCPPYPLPMGGVYPFSGFVTNTGDALLTNVVVFSGQAGQNLPLLGPLDLAPGESAPYTGSLTVPFNTFAVTVTVTSQETCAGTWITNTVSCPVATTERITITESCPPGPVTNGSLVVFGGQVCNTGNITLTNIFVFSSQSSNTLVLGPITLAPGACTTYTGSYIATGGSNPTTNTNIVTIPPGTLVTNVVSVIATNHTFTATPNTPMSFGTINSVAKTYADRFLIGPNFNGLTYDAAANGYEAMDFYSIRRDTTGASWYDSIIASTAAVTDRFAVPTIANPNLTFDALTYAADNVGYGPLLFYYLSHDNAGVTWFGSITPGGVVGLTANLFPVGNNMTFDVLTYTAVNEGWGADMFYYIRHDTNGVSWFGTINPTPGGIVLDRFPVGTNTTFVGLVFTPLTAPGYSANNFYYLRQNPTNGVTTFGTIFPNPPSPPISAVVTDLFTVGTNATELTYTFDNPAAFGANLFYYLRGSGVIVTTYTTNYTTNITSYTYTTYTTNRVVSFTPTNTVTVIGWDIGQVQTVAGAANCLGPVTPAPLGPVIGTANVNSDGYFSLFFPTEAGKWYFVQYKNTLTDPAWTDLPGMPVPGTGVPLMIYDPTAAHQPSRFYRIIGMP
jgi:uncharacterized repeat protein (TIGR01451 family)